MIKTYLFSITFILMSLIVYSQKMPKKLKVREVIVNSMDSTIKANIFIEDKKIKPNLILTYHWFKSGAINKNIGGYSGNLLHGEYVVYNMDHQMIVKGELKHGLKHGVWKRWLPQGGLLEKQDWKKGNLHGKALLYDKTGTKLQVTNYKKGKRHGKYILYEKGKETVITFKNGQEVDDTKEGFCKKIKAKIFKKKDKTKEKKEAKPKEKKKEKPAKDTAKKKAKKDNKKSES